MSQNIAVIGECMLEISRTHASSDTPDSKIGAVISYGGDTLNSSIYLARLGVKVDYVTALGDDALSEWMVKHWSSEGVGCDLVQFEPGGVPGLYMINIDDSGERSFSYWRDAAPARRLFDDAQTRETLFNTLLAYDNIYLSGISLAIYSEAVRQHLFDFLFTYRKQGGRVCFDGNYRARLWRSRESALLAYKKMYCLTDIALPTLEDEQALFSDATEQAIISRLQDWQVKEIVLKKGAEGCVVYNASVSPSSQQIDAPRLDKVIDTTAAGDSFNAAYLAARFSGKDCRSAAKFGHRLAGTVVQHSGAIIPNALTPKL